MKIGVIGSGNMGRSLGMLWAEQGHEVFFGGRTAEKGQAVAAFAGKGTQGGTNDQAAAFGEVLLYTVRGINPANVFSSTDLLAGKILIDPNNFDIPNDFNYPPIVKSLAETLAEQAPMAHVVKAFNTIPMEVFELAPEPLREHNVSVFIAGNDPAAKHTVMQLVEEIGFTPVDSGTLRNAGLIEGLANFYRFLLIEQKRGGYTTISLNVLPEPQTQRLGGRQPSSLK
ncbi:NAD(P)-binding domain-containing protein [Phormidium tenue FACHB-886]|nr:NAD(P)-binding domain-containing protein [Phormidium tenue FACHB-886]